MLYRPTQNQQESPPATHFNITTAIAVLAMCATLALVTTISSVDVLSFYTTMIGATTLYFVTSPMQPALPDIKNIPTRLTNSADNDDVCFETRHSALTDNKSARRSAQVVGEHSGERLTLEPQKTVQRLYFSAGVATTVLVLMLLVEGTATQMWVVPAELKTALLLASMVVLVFIINQLRKPMSRVVFDRNTGVFWIEQVLLLNIKVSESAHMPLHQVAAVQRVAHPCDKGVGTVLSAVGKAGVTQELNIVFRNAERVNVVCHKDCQTLHNDAAVLSNFLQVPVWV